MARNPYNSVVAEWRYRKRHAEIHSGKIPNSWIVFVLFQKLDGTFIIIPRLHIHN
jgi:hypothetical protein